MSRNIIAILRGVTPDEAVPITQCLIRKGITKIEIPLNSPNPFESIKNIKPHFYFKGKDYRGEKDLIITEIQIGDYLDEEDIIRYEDIYGREVIT